MNITKESTAGLTILTLTGRLDTLNFPLLESEMATLLENMQKNIVMDCHDLDYVSSSGLRVLLKSLKQVKSAGGKLALCSLQPQINQIFKISGFDHLFDIFPGKSEAIAAFN